MTFSSYAGPVLVPVHYGVTGTMGPVLVRLYLESLWAKRALRSLREGWTIAVLVGLCGANILVAVGRGARHGPPHALTPLFFHFAMSFVGVADEGPAAASGTKNVFSEFPWRRMRVDERTAVCRGWVLG